MNFFPHRIGLGLIVAVLLSSCTTPVSTRSTWREPGATATVYRKLLVVAVANDDNLRQSFEDIFVDTLRQHGVAAEASYPLIGDLRSADRSRLEALAQQTGSDAVIITHALSKSERANFDYATGSVQERTVVVQETTANSSTTIAMSAVGIAPMETDYVLAALQTRFFDADRASLVWTALSDIAESRQKGEVFWGLATQLTQAMSQEHLIEINAKPFHNPAL